MMIKAKDWRALPGSVKRKLLRMAMNSKGVI